MAEPTPVTLNNATQKSILACLYAHAQVEDTKGLRSWVLSTYYSDSYTPQIDDQNQPIRTIEGWAHDLHHKNRNFRKLEHLRELFKLLKADSANLEARQVREKKPGKGRVTWASIVRRTVYWIADHGEAAKAAVDQLPDEQLKFTSLKSFRNFADEMQLQANSHSDDPAITLAAELCLLTGTQTTDQLKEWIQTHFQGDTSELASWDFSDHSTLLTVQQVIKDIQSPVAA